MKKTIFTTLALGTAITFGGMSQASADEINYKDLAQKAKSDSVDINTKPVQEGNYDFSFSDGEFTYHFYNNNGNFGWEYHYGVTEATPVQKVDQQQAQFDYQNEQDTKDIVQPKQETVQPTSVSAPVQKETKQPTQSTSKSGGSTKEQFLQAGGTEAMWDNIVMPESTGNPNATNGQYSGLFQMSPQSGNGTGSVSEQTKSAIKYANERYGSVDNAISARQSKGWW